MTTTTDLAVDTVTDPDVKAGYGTDESVGATAPADFEVVRARDLADVVEVMRWAHETRTPVVPQGARSSLTGSSVAIDGGIVLNTERMASVTTIDPLEGIAVCGPGVVNKQLKDAVAEHGMFYPPDPASSAFCTIGGNVATNAGGLCCVKYGVTADYVRSLQVVLAGGEVIRTGHRTAKGTAGLDLTGLFVGSEGTLGVVTEVTTRIIPAPDPALTVLATFDSLDAASAAIVALRRERHVPSLVELLDRAAVAAVQSLADYGFPGDCEAVLLVQSDRPGHTGEDRVLAEAPAELHRVVLPEAQHEEAVLRGPGAVVPHRDRREEVAPQPLDRFAEIRPPQRVLRWRDGPGAGIVRGDERCSFFISL